MMPTVGCEADAVAFLEEGSNLLTGTDWYAGATALHDAELNQHGST